MSPAEPSWWSSPQFWFCFLKIFFQLEKFVLFVCCVLFCFVLSVLASFTLGVSTPELCLQLADSILAEAETQGHHHVLSSSGCINLSFAYVEGESLLMALKDVALSSGR